MAWEQKTAIYTIFALTNYNGIAPFTWANWFSVMKGSKSLVISIIVTTIKVLD